MNKRNGLPGADAADVFKQKIGRTDMQELEKILEEIEDERADVDEYSDIKSKMLARHWNSCIFIVQDIIRKHMNDGNDINVTAKDDGWIPVEERLPEKNEYFVNTSSNKDFPNGYYRRLEIAYMTDTVEYIHGYYDGYKWMDKYLDTIKNVVAWRIHEPYHPERSEEE